MTAEDDRPKTYEECLAEIQALKASPDYGNWGGHRLPNKGRPLTAESFRMDPQEIEEWAMRIEGLFATRPTPVQER